MYVTTLLCLGLSDRYVNYVSTTLLLKEKKNDSASRTGSSFVFGLTLSVLITVVHFGSFGFFFNFLSFPYPSFEFYIINSGT